jgi:hypothetical protein
MGGFVAVWFFVFWRDGRVAEGAPLLREYGEKSPSRVRIPLSPPVRNGISHIIEGVYKNKWK